MQAASLRTNGKVSYLSINGEDNESNAETYINTLTQRQCTLILAVGDSPVAAVRSTATRFPSTRFAVVDNQPSTANITAIPAGTPKDVTAAVQNLVTRAATQAAK
jgi:basic membrane lipoprotein Med (substrate-binding protein (PBP1-ABC) superfamily)